MVSLFLVSFFLDKNTSKFIQGEVIVFPKSIYSFFIFSKNIFQKIFKKTFQINKFHYNIMKTIIKRHRGGKWSKKYKKTINCNRPKGFSQKQYCKYGRKKTTKRK